MQATFERAYFENNSVDMYDRGFWHVMRGFLKKCCSSREAALTAMEKEIAKTIEVSKRFGSGLGFL